MEAEHIAADILDLNLGEFLNPYKDDGRDINYGHVLAAKMGKCRFVDTSLNRREVSTDDTIAHNIITLTAVTPSSSSAILSTSQPPLCFAPHAIFENRYLSSPFTYLAFY